jgi:hypothetical protein
MLQRTIELSAKAEGGSELAAKLFPNAILPDAGNCRPSCPRYKGELKC